MERKRIVFLDRDGTINVDSGNVARPADVKLIPGVAQSLARLRRAGFKLVVITNQAKVGRGTATRQDVSETNAELVKQLIAEDSEALLDEILICFHRPDEGCDCRKPAIGLLAQLPEDWQYDPLECWMVGDKVLDVGFGANAGIPGSQRILVLTGHGEEELRKLQTNSENHNLHLITFPSLVEATEAILNS